MKNFRSVAEQFAFADTIKDLELKPSLTDETAVRKELFGENFDPEKMVDEFEQQLGIKKPQEANIGKVLFKTIMLTPGDDDDDSKLLFQLMNDKELFPHLKEDHYWTARGEYKMFVIYGEDQDVKQRRDHERATQKENTHE